MANRRRENWCDIVFHVWRRGGCVLFGCSNPTILVKSETCEVTAVAEGKQPNPRSRSAASLGMFWELCCKTNEATGSWWSKMGWIDPLWRWFFLSPRKTSHFLALRWKESVYLWSFKWKCQSPVQVYVWVAGRGLYISVLYSEQCASICTKFNRHQILHQSWASHQILLKLTSLPNVTINRTRK